MKRMLLILLLSISLIAFLSCSGESDSPSMNEDYAGTWYFSFIVTQRLTLTDTTFQYDTGLSGMGYYPLQKGTVTKLSATQIKFSPTHASTGTTWYDNETDYAAALVANGETEADAASDAAAAFTVIDHTYTATATSLVLSGFTYSSTEP